MKNLQYIPAIFRKRSGRESYEAKIFENDGVQRSEDSLIAYTWAHFINDTSDPIWLARLPMTKAVVKAM